MSFDTLRNLSVEAGQPAASSAIRPSGFQAFRQSLPNRRQVWDVGANVGLTVATAVLAAGRLAPKLVRTAATLQGSFSATATAIAGTAGCLGAMTGAGFLLSVGATLFCHMSAGRTRSVPYLLRCAPYVALGVAISPLLSGPWTWPAVMTIAALVTAVATSLTHPSGKSTHFKPPMQRVGVACIAGVAAGSVCAGIGQGTPAMLALRECFERAGVMAGVGALLITIHNVLFSGTESSTLEGLMLNEKTLSRYRLEIPGEGRPTVFDVPHEVVELTRRLQAARGGWFSLTLHGPPGVGKTAIALGIGHALRASVIAPTVAQMHSAVDDILPICYMNASATLVESYELAERAGRPVVILWDEADSLWNTDVPPSYLHASLKMHLFITLQTLRNSAQRDGVSVLMINTTRYPDRVVTSFAPDSFANTTRQAAAVAIGIDLPSRDSLRHQLSTACREANIVSELSTADIDDLSTQLHRHGCTARHVQACMEHIHVMRAAGMTAGVAACARASVERICGSQAGLPSEPLTGGTRYNNFLLFIGKHIERHGLRGVMDACKADMLAVATAEIRDPIAMQQTHLTVQRFYAAFARQMRRGFLSASLS